MIFNTFLYGGGGTCEINCLEQMFTPSLITNEFSAAPFTKEFSSNLVKSDFDIEINPQFEFTPSTIKSLFSVITVEHSFSSKPIIYEFEAVDLIPN